MLKSDEDVLFGLVSLPSSDSRFKSVDELDIFEVEISDMCTESMYVYLIVDFYARTKIQEELIDVDNFKSDTFDFDGRLKKIYNLSLKFLQFNIDTKNVLQKIIA